MMCPDKQCARRKWHKGDLWAISLFLIGLGIVLFVATTEGEYLVWTLWLAIPMLMFSLAYLFLISALPIFLGPRSGPESETEEPGREDDK